MRIVFSGGGTGGHVYPAIAIADAIKRKFPKAEILFIGAIGKMEMERVPKAGYPIIGLWISGLQRKVSVRNLVFPFKLVHSLLKSWKILKEFDPQVVVGVGGYASGPALEVASRMGIPTLIQEQNSFPGITNRLLAKKVNRICVAYKGMDRFFPAAKIVMTGNPVRTQILKVNSLDISGNNHFKIVQDKKTLLLFGGSLGARSLNEAVVQNFNLLKERQDVQLIWQAGKFYYEEYLNSEVAKLPNVHIMPFIEKMDHAYALADVIISRAGALTISELCIVGKPSILIPSPNVAEDHQSKNADALVTLDAAIKIADQNAGDLMLVKAIELLDDKDSANELRKQLSAIAIPDADEKIANEVLSLINE